MNESTLKPIKTAAVVFLALASIFLAANTVSAIKGWSGRSDTVENAPRITVTGMGEEFATPTSGSFTFSVNEEGKTVQEAQTKATDRNNKAIDYLKKAGVEEKDIKTVGYNINPKYEYQQIVCVRAPCPSGKQILTGYEVSQSIQVKVRNPEKSGELLTGIGTIGVQNLSGLDFTLDTEEQNVVMRKARQEAIADAKAKAEVLANDLGVKLVRITDFQENGNSPIYYSRAEMGAGNQVLDSKIAPQVPTGENKITSNITITYEIR